MSGKKHFLLITTVAAGFFMLGVMLPDISFSQRDDRGVIGARFIETIIVDYLWEGLPADSADLQKCDIVKRINGEPIESVQELTEIMEKVEVGDTVQLNISRFSPGHDLRDEHVFQIETVHVSKLGLPE